MMLELFVLFTGLMGECAVKMSQLLSSKKHPWITSSNSHSVKDEDLGAELR